MVKTLRVDDASKTKVPVYSCQYYVHLSTVSHAFESRTMTKAVRNGVILRVTV